MKKHDPVIVLTPDMQTSFLKIKCECGFASSARSRDSVMSGLEDHMDVAHGDRDSVIAQVLEADL